MEQEVSHFIRPQIQFSVNDHLSPATSGGLSSHSSDAYYSTPGPHEESSSSSTSSNDSDDADGRHMLLDNEQGYSASMQIDRSSNEPSWELTVTKNSLCIKTNIRTHTELLQELQKIVKTLEFSNKVPSMFGNHTEESSIAKLMRILMWKRYNGSRYKTYVKFAPFLSFRGENETIQVIDESLTTLSLLDIYWNCQHLVQIMVHRPTFMKLYVDDGKARFSPATLALCAVICSLPCEHIFRTVPVNACVGYSKYYYERARQELCERFDEADLEIFLAYIFLAYLKFRQSDAKQSQKYADMAERLFHILEPMYAEPTEEQLQEPMFVGKREVFVRALQALYQIRHLLLFLLLDKAKYEDDDKEAETRAHEYKKMFNSLMPGNLMMKPIEGDSPLEEIYIQTNIHIRDLRHEAHKVVSNFQTADIPKLMGTFGHSLELVMKAWYNKLDPIYRLSIPLLDDSIDEDVMNSIIKNDCIASVAPLLTTIRVYSEYLIFAKSYISKCPYRSVDPSEAQDLDLKMRREEKWQRRVKKIMKMRKKIDFEGTDEEYLQTVMAALHELKETDPSLVDIAIRAAAITLKLFRYMQVHVLSVCLINLRVALDAADVLYRIARCARSQPDFIAPHVHNKVLRTLEGFIDLIRTQITRSPANPPLAEQISRMELMLQELMNDNDPLDLSRYIDI